MIPLPEHGHEPVMVGEVLRLLELADPLPEKKPRTFMDCTAGRGGHALHMAQHLSLHGGGVLIALDVDPANLQYTRQRFEAAAPSIAGVELRTFHANFAEAADVLDALQLNSVDGLLADFGVSTNQLVEAHHGLSFNTDAPLDMRLDPRIKLTAANLLAQWTDKQLADALHHYAQERFAGRIARKIVSAREAEPILTTGQLARLVRSVVPPPRNWGQIDPATRTFQALRMAVNSEIENLQELLLATPQLVRPDGRAVFLSFHSGEDRLVKHAIRDWETEGRAVALTKKPLEPGDDELQKNPRARSAKLRAIQLKNKVV